MKVRLITILLLTLSLSLLGIVPSGFAQAGAAFEKKTFQTAAGSVLNYAIMEPASVESGKAYPLIITLHGVGGRGKKDWVGNCYASTVLSKPAMREKYPCFVVAPTCERSETWVPFGRLAGAGRIDDVFELIEKALLEGDPPKPIDPKRIYITGQSMGGFGTFGAVLARPDFFAAAVPVCGGQDPTQAASLAKLPIWVFHGAMDKSVPVEMSRKMVEAIKAAGGQPRYTEYADVGHNAWIKAYDTPELWEWLFVQERTR